MSYDQSDFALLVMGDATGRNKINRHNIDMDERNSIVENEVTRT